MIPVVDRQEEELDIDPWCCLLSWFLRGQSRYRCRDLSRGIRSCKPGMLVPRAVETFFYYIFHIRAIFSNLHSIPRRNCNSDSRCKVGTAEFPLRQRLKRSKLQQPIFKLTLTVG